jgi:hypothetical protein
MKVWGVVLALLMAPSGVEAEFYFYSGNDLYARCTGTAQTACLGFVAGVSDTTKILQRPATVCLPEQVTTGEIKDVAVQFLASHPTDRHYSASSLVHAALQEAFPCPH